MSDLVVYQQQKQSLGAVDFIKDTLNQVRIREIKNTFEAKKAIIVWIHATSYACGIKEQIHEVIEDDLVECILSRFKSLSVDELYYAFKLERYGVYEHKTDHYQSFNAVYVSTVLKKYIEYKKNTRVKHNLPIAKTQDMPQLTQQEKDDLTYTGVINCFDKYVQDEYIINGYVWVYDHLQELKILNPEKESKLAAMKIAKKNLQKQAKENPNPSVAKKMIEDLEKKNSPAIIVEAKRLLLEQYFSELINKNKSIKNVLNETI